MEVNTLTCTVIVEWINGQGVVTRKVTHKSALSRVVRNESKKMFIEITTEKCAPIRLEIKGISVHKNFIKEGKASIKFPEAKCTVFYSNAPTGQLFTFLRNIFIKMTGGKEVPAPNKSLRTELLSKNKINQFEEISPVTVVELNKACSKITRTTDTTPSPSSRKRKVSSEGNASNVAKRLHAPSPILEEPLNIQQKEVLDACLAGYNVFFTGSAGTGKSYLLRKIIASLPPNATMATASTGVAACHIGGMTLHQFAGIGDGEASLERSYKMASKPVVAQAWRKCKHLIIDEISMVDGKYFEKIESVARHVRQNDKPFGGIQLILCGDFFQLPPIRKRIKGNFSKNGENDAYFCFQTSAWERCVQVMYELTQVHRQNDKEFIDILNTIRLGTVPDEMAKKLTDTSKQKIEQNGILATRLCSHTQDANIINESKLKNLPGELKIYEAEDSDKFFSKQMDQQTTVPGRLELKVGAQVMLLKNINIVLGLVNGARGVVKDFRDGLPVVMFRNSREYVAKFERWSIKTASGATLTRKQIPLRLAWAFSIHKSQGLTLDCVEMSLSRVFEAGQAYVALSRAQSLETLRVLDFKASQVWANPDVLKFYRKMRERIATMEMIPLGGKKPEKTSNGKPKLKKSSSKKLFSAPLVSVS